MRVNNKSITEAVPYLNREAIQEMYISQRKRYWKNQFGNTGSIVDQLLDKISTNLRKPRKHLNQKEGLPGSKLDSISYKIEKQSPDFHKTDRLAKNQRAKSCRAKI